jgi:hypothetical protein
MDRSPVYFGVKLNTNFGKDRVPLFVSAKVAGWSAKVAG